MAGAVRLAKRPFSALFKALEIFVNQDCDATLRFYDERAQVITDAVKRFGVTALPRQFNPQALGNVTPHYSWQIDPSKLNITGRRSCRSWPILGQSLSGAWAQERVACGDAIRMRLPPKSRRIMAIQRPEQLRLCRMAT